MNKFVIIGLIGLISYYVIVPFIIPRFVDNMSTNILNNSLDLTTLMNSWKNFSIYLSLFQLWWWGSVIIFVFGIVNYIKN